MHAIRAAILSRPSARWITTYRFASARSAASRQLDLTPATPPRVSWGGWIRTNAWRSQSPLPYRLATPHKALHRTDLRRILTEQARRCSFGAIVRADLFTDPGSSSRLRRLRGRSRRIGRHVQAAKAGRSDKGALNYDFTAILFYRAFGRHRDSTVYLGNARHGSILRRVRRYELA